jgi:hypothetical protein
LVFLDNPRSKQGRTKKYRRHVFAGKPLDTILRRDECNIVGAFWLPTIKHMQQIKNAMVLDADKRG